MERCQSASSTAQDVSMFTELDSAIYPNIIYITYIMSHMCPTNFDSC
jgi:hypothetical protein